MPGIIQVCWSGFGGQGVVLAGVLLGQAGVIDGRFVSASNSYGSQVRGSSCNSEIIFSDRPVDFPHLLAIDFFIAMSQNAYELYCEEVRVNSGLILYDRGLVNSRGNIKVKQVGISATETALKRLKEKQAANIVLLGTLIEKTGIVSNEAIHRAIDLHVSKRFRALNHEALEIGMKMGRDDDGSAADLAF